MTQDDSNVTRRTVLRTTAAATGGLAAAGGIAAGRPVGTADTDVAAAKRGGRAQVDGEVRRNEPFRISLNGTDIRNASCMSAASAMQTYLTYSIEYCDSDSDEDASMYVIPDEAELAPDDTYVVRSVTPCRANDLDKVATGPAQEDC